MTRRHKQPLTQGDFLFFMKNLPDAVPAVSIIPRNHDRTVSAGEIPADPFPALLNNETKSCCAAASDAV